MVEKYLIIMVFGSATCGAHEKNGIKFIVGDGFPVPNALQVAQFFYSGAVTQYLCDRFSTSSTAGGPPSPQRRRRFRQKNGGMYHLAV